MATENALKCITLEAGGNHSSNQYKFVSLADDGQFDLTGDGLQADGVLQDKPAAAGRAGQVAIAGQTKILLGATVARGADIASTAVGLAITAVQNDVILGTCVEGGDSGEIGSMIFHPRNIAP
jgi:hypothetical protein